MSLREPLIHYIGRELAGYGLVKNESWVAANVNSAGVMFDDTDIKVAAGLFAAVHPAGIDYLRQCPVLALAVMHTHAEKQKRRLMASARGRRYLAAWLAETLEPGPKLKALMAELRVAPPLRRIKGSALHPSHWEALVLLGRHVPPSTLAQAVPDHAFDQSSWLNLMTWWVNGLKRHEMDRSTHLAWAARNLQPDIYNRGHSIEPSGVERPDELLDYLVQPTSVFNPAWDWTRLSSVVRDWHSALADLSAEQAFVAKTGRAWDEPCDYGELPLSVRVDDYDFVALRSAQDLWEEGRAMHHCVSSYTGSVLKGKCRIYGIRLDEKRAATLEIEQRVNGWGEVQLKGSYNRTPSGACVKASQQFLRLVNGVPA